MTDKQILKPKHRGKEYERYDSRNRSQAHLLVLICVLLMFAGTCSAAAEAELHVLPGLNDARFQMTVAIKDFTDHTIENTFLMDQPTNHGTKAVPGLLSGYLGEDGFPMNQDGVSVATLFSGAFPVNGLFPEAPLISQGLWEFDSTQCFASLHGDSFTLYRELGTIESDNISLDHGQFLPINDLKEGVLSSYHPVNLTDAKDELFPDDVPRKGEPLYAIPTNEVNHYFGLTLDDGILLYVFRLHGTGSPARPPARVYSSSLLSSCSARPCSC